MASSLSIQEGFPDRMISNSFTPHPTIVLFPSIIIICVTVETWVAWPYISSIRQKGLYIYIHIRMYSHTHTHMSTVKDSHDGMNVWGSTWFHRNNSIQPISQHWRSGPMPATWTCTLALMAYPGTPMWLRLRMAKGLRWGDLGWPTKRGSNRH